MKYRYTAVYSLKGIHLPMDHCDIQFVEDTAIGLSAILTSNPDSYTYEGDRSDGLANMMLEGYFNGRDQSLLDNDLIADKVKAVCESRKNKIVGTTVLVVIGTGEVEWREPSTRHEDENFVICFNGGPKASIFKLFEQAITALTSAFSIEAKSLLEIKKVWDSVVYFQDNGKPVYLYTMSSSSTSYGSHTFSEDQLQNVGKLYHLFADDQSLQSVRRLLQSSLETESDRLRSFLSAWNAAEILARKVFPIYENNFFEEIAVEKHTDARQKYLEHIREVMKNLYTLVIKFAAVVSRLSPEAAEILVNKAFPFDENSFFEEIIGEKHTDSRLKYLEHIRETMKNRYPLVIQFAAMAYQLSPDTANEDLKELKKIKSVRDDILHGKPIAEALLPAKAVRELAGRYLQLHLLSGMRSDVPK